MYSLRDDKRRKIISKTTMASSTSSFAQMFDEILRRELTAVLSRVADGEGLELETLVQKYLPEDVAPAKATKTKAAPKKKRAAKVSVNPEPEEASGSTTSTKCTSTTAKGKKCSLKAVDGECMCRVHLKAASKPAAPPRVPRGPATGPVKPPRDEDDSDDEEIKPVRKPKKVKKTEQPKHSHELDEETHEDCELCQTHGSAMADTDDEEEFETVMSPPRTLRERLSRVVTEAYEDDEEEDD
jgi:hypothetical protein